MDADGPLISGALAQDVEIVSRPTRDGSPVRRNYLLGLLGPGAVETVLDPGRDVVTQRLIRFNGGVLTDQCGQAIESLVYGRL